MVTFGIFLRFSQADTLAAAAASSSACLSITSSGRSSSSGGASPDRIEVYLCLSQSLFSIKLHRVDLGHTGWVFNVIRHGTRFLSFSGRLTAEVISCSSASYSEPYSKEQKTYAKN